jgi:hypothetical protein
LLLHPQARLRNGLRLQARQGQHRGEVIISLLQARPRIPFCPCPALAPPADEERSGHRGLPHAIDFLTFAGVDP